MSVTQQITQQKSAITDSFRSLRNQINKQHQDTLKLLDDADCWIRCTNPGYKFAHSCPNSDQHIQPSSCNSTTVSRSTHRNNHFHSTHISHCSIFVISQYTYTSDVHSRISARYIFHSSETTSVTTSTHLLHGSKNSSICNSVLFFSLFTPVSYLHCSHSSIHQSKTSCQHTSPNYSGQKTSHSAVFQKNPSCIHRRQLSESSCQGWGYRDHCHPEWLGKKRNITQRKNSHRNISIITAKHECIHRARNQKMYYFSWNCRSG